MTQCSRGQDTAMRGYSNSQANTWSQLLLVLRPSHVAWDIIRGIRWAPRHDCSHCTELWVATGVQQGTFAGVLSAFCCPGAAEDGCVPAECTGSSVCLKAACTAAEHSASVLPPGYASACPYLALQCVWPLQLFSLSNLQLHLQFLRGVCTDVCTHFIPHSQFLSS